MKYIINENNMKEVMEKINLFFSKPTHQDMGITKQKKGTKKIKYGSEIITVPNIVEVQTYHAFPGVCEEHPIREKIRKEGVNSFYHNEDYETYLLGICTEYSYSLIPISVDDEIEINNKSMIINHYDSFIKNNCVSKFIHLKESYDDYDYLFMKKSTLLNVFDMATDNEVWEGYTGFLELISINREIIEPICIWFDNLETLDDFKSKTFSFNIEFYAYEPHIDIIVDVENNKFIFKFEENEFSTSTELVEFLSEKFYPNDNNNSDNYYDNEDYYDNDYYYYDK